MIIIKQTLYTMLYNAITYGSIGNPLFIFLYNLRKLEN